MLILAGDTSGKTSSVAVLQDDQVLVELNQYLGLTHSETFFPMIEDALKQARLKVTDIDLFACAVGPGSFTGTRIGVTAMKTFAFVNQKELIGINTLAALAEPYFRWQKQALVCATLAARNRRLFAASFQEGKMISVMGVCEVEPWFATIKTALAQNEHIYLVGDGYLEFLPDELQILKQNSQVTLVPSAFVSAAAIGRLAFKRYQEGERDDPLHLQPNYLVVTQAERTTGISYEASEPKLGQ